MLDYLFVTGRLAAQALQDTLEQITAHDDASDFEYEMVVLNASVAALMDTHWIAEQLVPDAASNSSAAFASKYEQIMISGWCQGDLALIEDRTGCPVVRGPKDLKDLPVFFGHERILAGYGQYEVKILGEIAEAYHMPWEEILAQAEYYRASGADVIDLGCPVHGGFDGVGPVVSRLKERGFTVSIDTFDPATILEADAAGVDLLLSINAQNMDLAPQLRCKVVVIPDFDTDSTSSTGQEGDQALASLERNVAQLEALGVPYIIDPILNPLVFGFTASLNRFYEARQRYPDAEMLMGLGNLTELTDADSTGINALMMGVITELGIDYVLTTEVISWARGAVRELDHARKLMYYAQQNRVLPKALDYSLVTIKDPPYESYTEAELRQMQRQVQDPNFRIFTAGSWIYVFNRDLFIRGQRPEEIFAQLDVDEASHAFYLGRELEKAALAVRLGKKYIQETPLRWGYLSPEEPAI